MNKNITMHSKYLSTSRHKPLCSINSVNKGFKSHHYHRTVFMTDQNFCSNSHKRSIGTSSDKRHAV